MKKILIFTLLGFSFHGVQGQINLSHPAVIDKTNSNVFLDASVNFSSAAGAANNVGKGLVIPSVDLVNFQFNPDFLSSTESPSFYDGMLVYNSATGTTLTTGNRSSTATLVSPGFYYFSNPSGSTNENITGGTWKPLSAAGTQGPAGPQGIQGPAGPAGVQGPIGLTGPTGAQGPVGASAYQLWLDGNTGTQAQFLSSLIGPAGPQGPAGATGAQGPIGLTGPAGPQGPSGAVGATGLTGPAGQNGLSNYQIAVNNGFTGSEVQWLDSIRGAQGPAGPAGPQGEAGSNASVTGTAPIEVSNGVVSIADAGIGASKLSDMGATAGQALVWNGTAWAPSETTNIYNSNGILTDDRIIDTNGKVLTFTNNNATSWSRFFFKGGTPSTGNGIINSNSDGNGSFSLVTWGSNNGLRSNGFTITDRTSGGGDRIAIDSIGNVGINLVSTDLISAKLDVNGTTRIRNLSGTGSRMVIADETGLLSTQDVTTYVEKDITSTELVLDTKIDGAQLYAIKGTFTASGSSALVTIAKPAGMTGYYSLTTYKDGKTFRRDISSFDMIAEADNVITGTGAYSEVYPAGTYNYVLEYFK